MPLCPQMLEQNMEDSANRVQSTVAWFKWLKTSEHVSSQQRGYNGQEYILAKETTHYFHWQPHSFLQRNNIRPWWGCSISKCPNLGLVEHVAPQNLMIHHRFTQYNGYKSGLSAIFGTTDEDLQLETMPTPPPTERKHHMLNSATMDSTVITHHEITNQSHSTHIH